MNREKIFSLAERWNEYFIYGFIFFTPVGHGGAAVCFGFLALCFVLRKIVRPDFHFLEKSENLWLLLFFVFCALSLFNSGPYLQKSLKALFFKWSEYILVFLLVREALAQPAKLKRVGQAILIVATIIAIDSFIQFFWGSDLFYSRQLLLDPGFRAITATFKNSNDLASYLGFVIMVPLAMAVAAPTQKARWILGMLTLVLGICLLLTFSRGGWLGFLGGLFLMILVSRRWKVLLPVLFLFIVAILMNSSIAERAIADLPLGAGQQTGGLSDRSKIWGMGFQLIRENPLLGKGLGTFMDYCGQRLLTVSANYAHNCYLQIWAESGIFSLVFFLLFVVTIFWKGIAAFKKQENALLLGLLCGLFAFLIHSFFDTQLYSVSQSFLFWSMLGVFAAATQNTSGPSGTSGPGSTPE